MPGSSPAPIARGAHRASIDLDAARAVPGVLDILTHENVGDAVKPPKLAKGGMAGPRSTARERPRSGTTARSSRVVVAETLRGGAARPRSRLDDRLRRGDAERRPSTVPGVETVAARDDSTRSTRTRRSATPRPPSPRRRSTIDARYATPTQHHNPIELFTTTCVWDGRQPDDLGAEPDRLRLQERRRQAARHRPGQTCASSRAYRRRRASARRAR